MGFPSLYRMGILQCNTLSQLLQFSFAHKGLQTAPPAGHPRIVSKLLTLEYESMICRQVSIITDSWYERKWFDRYAGFPSWRTFQCATLPQCDCGQRTGRLLYRCWPSCYHWWRRYVIPKFYRLCTEVSSYFPTQWIHGDRARLTANTLPTEKIQFYVPSN